ncbi:hypothetical protein DFS34DRAFT_650604 [Phlyctochytrium arcticum]|nr:hypothetical protein DFS34DRAFT_650604 [Phlyctochytrium arcticum]
MLRRRNHLYIWALFFVAAPSISAKWFGQQETTAHHNEIHLPPRTANPAAEEEMEVEFILDAVFRGHLSREERLTLEHATDSLSKYGKQEGSCFRNAATELRAGCADMQMTDAGKVRYAIMLTKCEIATAGITSPRECQVDHADRNLPACVEVLSRVPQLWTSYSGYLREVVNMCFAAQYEAHQENLQRMFLNVTRHQISTFRLIQRQTSDLTQWHAREMATLRNIESIQGGVQTDLVELQRIARDSLRTEVELRTNLAETQEALKTLVEGQQSTTAAFQSFIEQSKAGASSVKNVLSSTALTAETVQMATSDIQQHMNMVLETTVAILRYNEEQQRAMDSLTMEIRSTTMDLKDKLTQLSASSDHALEQIERVAQDSTQSFLQLVNNLDDLSARQQDEFGRTLEILSAVRQISNENLRNQQEMHASLDNMQVDQQKLAGFWASTFQNATDTLDTLEKRSSRQIQLLLDAAEMGYTRHAKLLSLTEPFLDISEWIISTYIHTLITLSGLALVIISMIFGCVSERLYRARSKMIVASIAGTGFAMYTAPRLHFQNATLVLLTQCVPFASIIVREFWTLGSAERMRINSGEIFTSSQYEAALDPRHR